MSVRMDRVRGSIRREIAEMLLRQEIHDPRLTGFVSITDVRMSSDLQYATVYFTVMGGGGVDRDEQSVVDHLQTCQNVLMHASGFIRSQLGKRLALRHTPSLRFLPDNSLNQGRRIETLLQTVALPPDEKEQGEEEEGAPSVSQKGAGGTEGGAP